LVRFIPKFLFVSVIVGFFTVAGFSAGNPDFKLNLGPETFKVKTAKNRIVPINKVKQGK
jgi:hypothetical protein